MTLAIGVILVLILVVLVLFMLLLTAQRKLKPLKTFQGKRQTNKDYVEENYQQDSELEITDPTSTRERSLENKTFNKLNVAGVDPFFEDANDDISDRLKSLLKITSTLADNYQILFGISGGLLAMSFVALAFHFFENVIQVETSSVRWATAYSAFFAVLTIGIFKNKYIKRKLVRLENEKLNMELRFRDQLSNLRLSYEEILSKSQDEKNLLIDGHSKMLEELDGVLKERENTLERFKQQEKEARRNSKRRWLFKKLSS
jgi:ABC-type uncharacterized transport system fused permease/ATPase subunit